MKVTKQVYGSHFNCNANEHLVSIPITVDFAENDAVKTVDGMKVVKGGTPMLANGKPAPLTSTTTCVGILLSDVYEDNPNGALMIHGFVDEKKAVKNVGSPYSTETKAKLPMIAFI